MQAETLISVTIIVKNLKEIQLARFKIFYFEKHAVAEGNFLVTLVHKNEIAFRHHSSTAC